MKKRVPYEVIVAAKAGDSEAMGSIMKFYDPLMNHLCKESGTDANGRHYEKVNEDLKARLMQHMRKQIIEVYDITRQPPEKRA